MSNIIRTHKEIINDDGSINHNNIDEEKAKDSLYIQKLIKQLKK